MRPVLMWMVVLVILLVAGAVYVAAPSLRPEVHLCLSKWCHGVSAGKIGFFLITMSIGLVWLVVRAARRDGHDAADQPRSSSLGLLTLGIMLLGWIASLCSCLIYHHAFAIEPGAVSYHWLGGLPSVNSVQHIHTSKGALASAIDLAGLSQLHARFDTGLGYAKVVPWWLQGVLGVSFVLALVLGLAASGRIADRFAPAERGAAGLAWLIAWTWGSKCILDGGPLGYDAILSLVLGLSVAGRAAGWPWRWVRSMIVAAVAAWLVTHLLLSVEGAIWQGLRMLERGAWLAAVLGIVLRLSCKQRSGVVSEAAHQAMPIWLLDAWMKWRVILPAWTVAMGLLAMSYASEVAPLRTSALGVSVTQITTQAEGIVFQPVTAGFDCLDCAQVYQKLGEQPSRVRRISMAHHRPPGATGMHVAIRPVGEAKGAVFTSRGDIELVSIEPRTDARGTWLTMDLAFAAGRGPVVVDGWGQRGQMLENERFIAMLAADAYIRQAGIGQYVMVPMSYYARKADEPAPGDRGQKQ